MSTERPKPLSVTERKLLVAKALKIPDNDDLAASMLEKVSDDDLRIFARDISEEEMEERAANSDFPEGLEPGLPKP